MTPAIASRPTAGGVWFARGSEIARWVERNPDARCEVDFDVLAS